MSAPIASDPRTGSAGPDPDAGPRADLGIGEVAAEAGVAITAVRFYADHGVVRSERDAGNRRRFDVSAGCRIKVAKLAQRVGLTVREIAELLDALPADPSPDDWRAVATTLIDEAERRVGDLRTCLVEMDSGGRLCEAVDRL